VHEQFQSENLKKRAFGRPKHRWEDNIKMDLKEIGYGLDSSGSGHNPVAGSFEHSNKPVGSIISE
jgi:hypothetical protein